MLDPSLILCENCGYDVGSIEARLGADPSLNCPECARPIAESLPERRVGTAWQRRRSVANWARTLITVLRAPRRGWSGVRVAGGNGFQLAAATCAVASVLWTVVLFTGIELLLGGDDARFPTADAVLVHLSLSFSVFALSLGASAIEALGLRMLGWRRGWRVTHAHSWTIVGHASVGWMLAAPCLALSLVAAYAVFRSNWPDGWSTATLLVLAIAAVLVPLLAFETLVYLGFRAMRFANAPR